MVATALGVTSLMIVPVLRLLPAIPSSPPAHHLMTRAPSDDNVRMLERNGKFNDNESIMIQDGKLMLGYEGRG